MAKTKRPAFHNPPPANLPHGVPIEAVKAEFAKRLQAAMVERGWNQSELARRAALHTADKKFGRDNVSGYICGTSLPGPTHLAALGKALKIEPRELVPMRGMPSVDEKVPTLDVKDLGNGTVWLRINQAVEWPAAVQVMNLLKGAAS